MLPYDNPMLIAHAIRFASFAFGFKLDRLGKPMILHSLRVGLAGKTPDQMIVGFLHDVVEDTDKTLDDLAVWPDHIVVAVDALSRRDGEGYVAFIERIRAAGPLAIAVKRNDIADNLARIDELLPEESVGLRRRYTHGLAYLSTGAWPVSESQTRQDSPAGTRPPGFIG